MKRNPKADYNAAQHVAYDQLPEVEKEKDRVHVRTMMSLLGKQGVTEDVTDMLPGFSGGWGMIFSTLGKWGIPVATFAAVAAAYGVAQAAIWLQKGHGEFGKIAAKAMQEVDKDVIYKMADKLEDLQNKALAEHIGKVKGGYRLYSHKGENLGTFDSKKAAKNHEREVQYFKHAGSQAMNEQDVVEAKTPAWLTPGKPVDYGGRIYKVQKIEGRMAHIGDETKNRFKVPLYTLYPAGQGLRSFEEDSNMPVAVDSTSPIPGVAEAHSPEEFVKNIKNATKKKIKFQVGDWVTIDPNETAGWATSGMIGKIVDLTGDGRATINVNPGGGATGVQRRLTGIDADFKIKSGGTHTVVPVKMLELLPVSLDEEGQQLHVGDPVIITGSVEFNGATGDIVEFGRSQSFVVVDLYNYGKHSFHTSNVEYNKYADRDDDEVDIMENYLQQLKRAGYDIL
jgi:hypothetical protein